MARAIPYKQAIHWIAANDDTEWLEDDEPMLSVSASLVADIYGKPDGVVVRDLRRATKRVTRTLLANLGALS